MRTSLRTSTWARPGFALAIVAAGSLLLMGGSKSPYSPREKAYYADANQVNFIRPGLVAKITGADVQPDGTIHARFKLTDPKGLPLDRDGVVTPGLITTRLTAAYIPKDATKYVNYVLNATTKAPTTDAGGLFEKTAEGEYQYTFVVKAPAGYDRSATHTIGLQASRDLREFDMGVQPDNDTYTFVPDGSAVVTVRDVVRTETCNKRCHDPLAAHGGNRRKVEFCILCHQPQNVNAAAGSLDFSVFIHKIHRGADLPSVKAGGKFALNANNDWSTVVFPAGVRNCEVCHDAKSGAAQADAWLKPNRAACGSCHDDVNFATGEGHVNLPQVSDNLCANCHIPQGDLEFDASIRGAHLDPRFSQALPGVVFEILSVDNARPGQNAAVAFTVKDKAGNPIAPSTMTSLSLTLAGPTTDYSWSLRDDVRQAQVGGANTWTFSKAIPSDTKGTYSVAIEGYRNVTLLPGTTKQQVVRDAGVNQIAYVSVDGSKAQPRRAVVSIDKCNQCHLQLELHGRNRNRIEHCVQCHNPTATDAGTRPASAGAPQGINFPILIHSIHSGENLRHEFSIYGGSGNANNFNDVRFPGDRHNCAKCHVNNSEQLPLAATNSKVMNPQLGFVPGGPEAAACTGCHADNPTIAHTQSMTDPNFGEACAVCHGSSAEFSVNKAHAR